MISVGGFFVVIKIELGSVDLVGVVGVLGGKLLQSVVMVLENPVEVPVDIVSLAVLGVLEEAVHEVVFGLPECCSFDVWRKVVGEAELVDILERDNLSVVPVVPVETTLSVLGKEILLSVVSEVEAIGSSDGLLFVDMETILGDPGAAVEMDDSGAAV